MPDPVLEPTVSYRQREIASNYLRLLDQHIADLRAGKAERVMRIGEFAQLLFIHPVHLSNTVKEVTGQSTCDHFETRLLDIAKDMILNTDLSIGQIAIHLLYDPSNFTKFFKEYTGTTPKKFRDQFRKS